MNLAILIILLVSTAAQLAFGLHGIFAKRRCPDCHFARGSRDLELDNLRQERDWAVDLARSYKAQVAALKEQAK